MPIDEGLLLRFLDEHRQAAQKPLVAAIYDGLAGRVRRGDFKEVRDAGDR